MAETQVGTDFMVGEAEAGSNLVAADPAPLGAVLTAARGMSDFSPREQRLRTSLMAEKTGSAPE